MNIPDNKSVARISVGFDKKHLDLLKEALRTRYPHGDPRETLTRGNLIRIAVWFYCCAIVRQDAHGAKALLACDLRRETEEEFQARTEAPQAKAGAPVPGMSSMSWLRWTRRPSWN